MKGYPTTLFKAFLITIFLMVVHCLTAQKKFTIGTQPDRLNQYSGHWVSSIHPNTDSIAAIPNIKMVNRSVLNQQSLQVTVLQQKKNAYQPILVELMGYDPQADIIFAAGQNEQGAYFTGKGKFLTERNWVMQDTNLLGQPTMKVNFDFLNFTDVVVEGFNTNGQSLWKTRYIKNNPKDKNIGIQLVSVHQDMQKDPEGTLLQLSRMGYSYIETFVYKDRAFYGMPPLDFRQLVENVGMQFLGSMTFYDLPAQKDWDKALAWWQQCIEDHKIAGVAYLSTSNHQLKSITKKSELQRYCDYYNAIGKLCKENDLQFIFHNHADEFLPVEGIRIYDYLLQNTNPDYVAFQADLYWMHIGGVQPIDYFKKYPNRFLSWHVKDYQELGASGKIDFKEIFKYASKAGLKYTVAEVEDYNFPPLYGVNLAWNYLYYELLKKE